MRTKIIGLVITLAISGLIFTTPKCHIRNDRPDPNCTPGALLNVTVAQICTPGYASKVRNVPQAKKQQVLRAYGLKSNPGEIDHLISLELGGSNDLTNLWPQTNYKDKDKLENLLHRQVCEGKLSLPKAQALIKGN